MKNYGGQETVFYASNEKALAALADMGPAWTGVIGERIVGCAGFVVINKWRAQAWALLQRTHPRDFVHVDRAVRRVFANAEFACVETFTRPTHPAAERWVRALGFKMVVPYKPFFFPDGSGASEWVWHPKRRGVDAVEARQ